MDLPRMIELLTVPELTSAPSLGHGRIARLILGLREVLIPLVRDFQKNDSGPILCSNKKITGYGSNAKNAMTELSPVSMVVGACGDNECTMMLLEVTSVERSPRAVLV